MDRIGLLQYGKDMLKEWIAKEPNWQTEIHKKGLRWTPSWDYNSDGAFAALHEYMATPVSSSLPAPIDMAMHVVHAHGTLLQLA